MRETNFISSQFYKQKFRIHGNLAHDQAPDNMRRWFVYAIEDQPCKKTIVGSTSNPTQRWRNHKSSCNNGPSLSTGLAKHFTLNGGCPNDTGREKNTLNFTLIDHMDVTEDELDKAGHVAGPKCRCNQCEKLKNIEDKWILRMATFYGEGPLNTRDEIQSKTRYNWGGGETLGY